MRRINERQPAGRVRRGRARLAAATVAVAGCAVTSACLQWPLPAAPLPPTPAPGPRVVLPRAAPATVDQTPPSIFGHARTPAGKPVATVTVDFRGSGGRDRSARTDGTGYYAVTLPADTYEIRCTVATAGQRCGVRDGDDQPYLITVPPVGQTADLIVCAAARYPACLKP